MKAWKVEVKGWPEATGIVIAETRGKALARGWVAARDAGYNIVFGDFRARRAPRFDGLDIRGGAATLEHAEHLLATAPPTPS